MLELFTERGRRVIARAQDLAYQQRDPVMRSGHLLSAALQVDRVDAAPTARRTPAEQDGKPQAGSGDDFGTAVSHSIPPTPNARRAMSQAALQAREAGSRADVSHLVAQLLSLDDTDIDQAVVDLGINRDEAYRRAVEQCAADERRPQARSKPIGYLD